MEPMKNYRQFIKDIPRSSVVYAIEDYAIPNQETDIIIRIADKLAESNSCQFVVILCNESVLSLDVKSKYLHTLYPKINFIKSKNPVATIQNLGEKYNTLIQLPPMIMENASSITKMIGYAKQADYASFKRHLPSNTRDMDGKRLMNDVRQSLGLDNIKEHIKFNVDELREKYFRKEIFNIGDIVESNNESFEILDRGSNYLVLVNSNGETSKKWIQDVVMSENTQLFTSAQFRPDITEVPEQISFKGYTTKNLNRANGAAKAFQMTIQNMGDKDPLAVLNALKATDDYLGLSVDDILRDGQENAEELTNWNAAHLKAKRILEQMGEFALHAEYWHLYKTELDRAVYAVKIPNAPSHDHKRPDDMPSNFNEQFKVANAIAKVLNISEDKTKSPTEIINTSLSNISILSEDSTIIVSKLLDLAESIGINYNKKTFNSIYKSNLTEGQLRLAMERAERYGRRYPNPIDNQWALAEGKAPSIVVDKSKSGNMASLRPDDEKKLINMNLGIFNDENDLPAETKKEIENLSKTGHKNPNTPSYGVGETELSHVGSSLTPGKSGTDTIDRMKVKYMKEEHCCEDESEEDIDKMIDKASDDDFLHSYDPDELHVIDSETGEKIDTKDNVNEEILSEVLSTMERIKAKLRMAKYSSKIERKRMLALRKHSNSKQINKRARHMAVHLMRKKLLKGAIYEKLSVGEKARIDKIIEKKAAVIGRMAMKLAPKVRKFEQERLSHNQFTEDA